MAKKLDKEALFENYFETASMVLSTFESIFDVEGVWSKVFGVNDSEKHKFSTPGAEQAAKDHVRASIAWYRLSQLYDYAVDGIISNVADASDVVIDGAEVLSFITTENYRPADEWKHIIYQGDGRYAVDDGEDILLKKLILLAGVDVRTARNAISAGELATYKQDDVLFVENASARNWLSGRRGFKPTRELNNDLQDLKEVSRPAEFGAFLSAQRKRIGLDGDAKKLAVFHPSVDSRAISEIEMGVFKLPIDTVFPIADFYQIDRKEFLSCVMRVFFREQLSTLREAIKAE